MKELLEKYREILATGKAICYVYLEVHKDEDGELYANVNHSLVSGLVNTKESLLADFLKEYSGLVDAFGINDTGDYEFECVLNLAKAQWSDNGRCQPDFIEHYELEYCEAATPLLLLNTYPLYTKLELKKKRNSPSQNGRRN